MFVIIDLFEKLVDRCIQLAGQHSQHKREFFNDYIAPSYELFEQVHQQYLEHFKGYRAALSVSGPFQAKAERLCNQIREDNLFTADKRAKVLQLAQARKDFDCSAYISSVQHYLLNVFESVDKDGIVANPFRTVVYHQFGRETFVGCLQYMADTEFGADEFQQYTALRILDNIVFELQNRHALVTDEFLKLKQEMTA